MRNKLYWGLGVLIILFIAVGSFVFYQQWTELQQMKKKAAEDDKQREDHLSKPDEPIVSSDKPITKDDLPAADPGFKWVQHDDHFHQVPIDAPDEWQGGPHAPIAQDVQVYQPSVTQTYDGPLTFHEELLKTNPVKALRLQQEERGHWSAAWIPPFPPDDTEAQEFARAQYLRKFYVQTYGFEKLGTPEYEMETKAYREAREISNQIRRTIRSYPYGARKMDLMKLTWPSVDKVVVSDSSGRIGGQPSEYFGDPKMRAFMKEHGTWDY